MDIASGAQNRFLENLSFARIYFVEAAAFWILSVTIAGIALELSFPTILGLLFADLFLITLFLYIIGGKRKQVIWKIKSVVKGIRDNEFQSPDEISLGSELIEIEGDVKRMFLRTRNDIANLEKLEQVRTEFLGNVSHELRTPIFAIQGYLETLINGAIDDPAVNRNFLNKAILHTENLNNLLNDLIDISMIESGQMKMSFRYFDFDEYITGLIEEMIPLAENKGLKLEYIPSKKPFQLFGDKKRLRQVFVNLLSNAIKYTEKGTVTLTVEKKPSKMAKITVKDTGIGIPEADIDRIFERFYRVDKGRSRAVGGTGLGLAIVKHILEAHGTRPEVTSSPGKGSEFSFMLKR